MSTEHQPRKIVVNHESALSRMIAVDAGQKPVDEQAVQQIGPMISKRAERADQEGDDSLTVAEALEHVFGPKVAALLVGVLSLGALKR